MLPYAVGGAGGWISASMGRFMFSPAMSTIIQS